MTDDFDLTPSLYNELEQRARAILSMRRVGEDPETLSLVHQACLKILKGGPRSFETRAEFLSFCARTMRHVLIDLARGRNAQRRGGGKPRLSLDEMGDRAVDDSGAEAEILDVNDKLDRLRQNDPRLAKLIELKFFGGCTRAEIGEVLGLSGEVVDAEWQFGKVWLRGALSGE